MVPLEHICWASGKKIETLNFTLRAQGRVWPSWDPINPCDLFNSELPQVGLFQQMYGLTFQRVLHTVSAYWHSRGLVLSEYELGRLFILPTQLLVGRRLCWLLSVSVAASAWLDITFIKDREPAGRQCKYSRASIPGLCSCWAPCAGLAASLLALLGACLM